MGIAIASRDLGWVSKNNLLAQSPTGPFQDVPHAYTPEWYHVDTNYGPGCSVWEIDGARIFVARNMRDALQNKVGMGWDLTTDHPLLYGYVDLNRSFFDLVVFLEDLGFTEAQHLRWLTPELAAPPVNRMMPNG